MKFKEPQSKDANRETHGTRLQLFLAAGAIALVWQLPMGHMILYPLTLLGTFVHEMGHGLTALLLGNAFIEMVIHMDGSGMARWQGSPGRMNLALIAAGGLVGPSVAGSLLLILSRTTQGSRFMLMTMASLMLLSALVWVRNPFGLALVLGWAVLLASVGRITSDRVATFVLHVVAITLCLSIFSDISYMFSSGAVVDGVTRLSDSAQMAQALFLPYWVWGAVVASFSVAVMAIGIVLATKSRSFSEVVKPF